MIFKTTQEAEKYFASRGLSTEGDFEITLTHPDGSVQKLKEMPNSETKKVYKTLGCKLNEVKSERVYTRKQILDALPNSAHSLRPEYRLWALLRYGHTQEEIKDCP